MSKRMPNPMAKHTSIRGGTHLVLRKLGLLLGQLGLGRCDALAQHRLPRGHRLRLVARLLEVHLRLLP